MSASRRCKITESAAQSASAAAYPNAATAASTALAWITLGVNLEDSVALRLRRQSVVTREESPAELWCVVEEQVLRRPVGDPSVMAGQLDHLLELTKRPNINLQVIPHEVGVHPALTGAFFLLRFDDDWRVAYEETRRFAYYLRDRKSVV